MHYATRLFNDGWQFALCPAAPEGTVPEPPAGDAYAPVALPHDWLIANAGDPRGPEALYADGDGWYRRILPYDGGEDVGLILRFEGIYMDSALYLNGALVTEWKNGYTTFEVDLTDFLHKGDNELLVRVTHRAPNSRWYSGAGIYRNVWLKTVHRRAFLRGDSSYAAACETAPGRWELTIETEVETASALPPDCGIRYRLLRGTDAVLEETSGVGPQGARCTATLEHPEVWAPEHPACYTLEINLCDGDTVLQQERQTIGFRTLRFSPDEGFFLNGRHLKLKGVCEHHDLGCLGAAYNSSAMRRRLMLLRGMGVNALRLAHNPHAPDLLELADELGFLVISEGFDMWQSSKNPYDYARFFDAWYRADVAAWVRRDRCHPCLLMWSIGNEIYDTHVSEKGQQLTALLAAEVRRHDPLHNAPVTLASNYMPWENAQKCADLVKLAGYNYGEKYYAAHHAAHPDWVIYGSETGSVVASRGIYHFPFRQPLLSDVDEQCSALGNSSTSWGAKSPEATILAERDCAFSCGQFLWTGFDYIGEPTPYHTRSSYFGQLDTAGFAKDSYAIYRAAWGDETPFVHLFPYWSFNDGQLIDVRAATNAPAVELFLNGESKGLVTLDHAHGNRITAHWQLPYAEGELLAVAYDGEGREIARTVRRSFGDTAALRLTPEQQSLAGDGESLAFFVVSAVDAAGNPVENAADRVRITVSGAGVLAGLDNGDSTDADGYKTDSLRLFSGKLLVVVASDGRAGELTVTATAPGVAAACVSLPVTPATPRPGIAPGAWRAVAAPAATQTERPVRALRLRCVQGSAALTPAQPTAVVTAALCPADADDNVVRWCAVDDAGVPSELAELAPDGLGCTVRAVSDGAFRLRCLSCAGTANPRVISELDFTVSGFGRRWLDPYGFISASRYDACVGEVGNGNEHGVATQRGADTVVGFHGVDFGPFGSDEITLPVFALDGRPYPLQIWQGMAGEPGSLLLADVVYQKPSRWNVYQPATYRLNRRLSGVTALSFVLHDKVHLKGFSFTKREKAFEALTMADSTAVYGDSFTRTDTAVLGIGNNVTIEFSDMDFGTAGTDGITLCGATPLTRNAIRVLFQGAGDGEKDGDVTAQLEFAAAAAPTEQRFSLPVVRGARRVQFVFLPGSRFDFYGFRFQKAAISEENKQ